METFLSVKDFSKYTGISVTTLRYWDKIGLFSPLKRGDKNNYRYYSLQQIVTINFISVLTELGIPIKTIQEINENRNPENIIKILENQVYLLDKKLRKTQEMYSIIHTRGELIRTGLNVDINKISVVNLPERAIIFGAPTRFKDNDDFYEPFSNFYRDSEKFNINLRFPIGALHENLKEFFETPNKPKYFFSLDPLGKSKQKAGKYLVGYTRGYYGEIHRLVQKMQDYAKENSINLAAPIYVIYLHDEICINNPQKYLAQVCINIKK